MRDPVHMTDTQPATIYEFGGLRFDTSTRTPGATLRVFGEVDGAWTEILRFDDFVEGPHFHVPSSGPPRAFDRSLGEPLAWYIAQVRDHLAEWVAEAGFETVLATVDLDEVSRRSELLYDAMQKCIPSGCVRVPGVGLQRIVDSE